MKIENILGLFGLLLIVVSYILLLAAFGVVEESQSFYILSGLGGIVVGTALLGFSKLIKLQEETNKHLHDLASLARAQNRAITELKPKKSATNTAQKTITNPSQPAQTKE